MKQIYIFTLLISCMGTPAMAIDTSATEGSKADCIAALSEFPVKDLEALGTKKQEGQNFPQQVTFVEDKRVLSSLGTNMTAFFAANVMPGYSSLDARKTDAFRTSLAISFLEDYGNIEMSMLGPDLSKSNPFLDMPKMGAQAPSADKVDETSATLDRLAARMSELLSQDQKSTMQKLLSGEFSEAFKDVESSARLLANRFRFTRDMFASFLTDKRFLSDIQRLLAGNLEQFEKDVRYIDEIQARYRKTRDALELLAQQGTAIMQMRDGILASINDEYTKDQVRKAFVRYDRRLTDITSGIAIAETFINVWEVIKDNHYDLIAGIKRALYYNVAIIGAQAELNNALARQERTEQALQNIDNYRSAMIDQLNARMRTSVENRQRQELKSIEEDTEALGRMVTETILVQQSRRAHEIVLAEALAKARDTYTDITAQARAQNADQPNNGTTQP